MRYFFILLVLCSGAVKSIAQDIDTIYYNEGWEMIDNTKEAVYFRVYANEKTNGFYELKDYFISGELQMSGQYTDIAHEDRTGEFKAYYENGQLNYIATYKNNRLEGTYESWYEDGTVKSEVEYKRGRRVGEANYYFENGQLEARYLFDADSGVDSVYWFYEDGQPEAVGTMIGDQYNQSIRYFEYWNEMGDKTITNGVGEMTSEYSSGASIKGPMEEGFRNGKWTKRDSLGQETGQFKFKDGIFVKGYLTDNGFKDKFKDYNRQATFQKGGEEGLWKYIGENLGEPCDDFIYNKLLIEFVVDETGSVTEVNVLEGETSECQMDGLRETFQSMPTWLPGISNGMYVKTRYSISLDFSRD